MIPAFALRLICGLSTMWCLSPRKEITSGFFRIQMLVTLGLGVLIVLSRQTVPDSLQVVTIQRCYFWIGVAIAISSFLGSVMWTLERRKLGMSFAINVAALSTFGIWMVEFYAAIDSAGLITSFMNALTSAWLFGAVTGAMLLGHWYLTATGMKLQPLIRMNQLFLVAVVVRTAFWLWLQIQVDLNWTDQGMLLSLRWAGLIGPLVMAWLTIQTLKYRNTQSATGVLYAATTLVFMGETAAVLILQR